MWQFQGSKLFPNRRPTEAFAYYSANVFGEDTNHSPVSEWMTESPLFPSVIASKHVKRIAGPQLFDIQISARWSLWNKYFIIN